MLRVINKLLQIGSSSKLGFATVATIAVILLALVALAYLKKEDSANTKGSAASISQTVVGSQNAVQNNQNGNNNYQSTQLIHHGAGK